MPAALLDEVLHAVIAAGDDGDAVQAAVDGGASRLAADDGRWGAVSRAFLVLAERVVDGCWARGWEPADVLRMARRRLDDRHVRLAADVVSAAARRESRTGRGPRWATQVGDLGGVWWSGDEGYLGEFARREGLMRFEAAGCALEVLRMLARLPGITPLAAEAAEPVVRRTGTEPRMLPRIRALLAKAESTGFPEEAEALTAKAQELIARYSIDEALLADQGARGDGPTAIRVGVDAPYDAEKAMLLDAVAEANRCRTVWSREFGFSTVIGFAPDLDAVDLLYTSLLVQATAVMTRGGGKGRGRSRDFRQSFLIAYADRIGERLANAAQHAEQQARREAAAADAADRLLPVLASRAVAVQDATDTMFPNLVTHRVRIRDAEGWTHGKAAADRADLGTRRPRLKDRDGRS